MKAPKFLHALISFLAVIILVVPSSCDKLGGLQEENVLVSITGRAQKGQFTKGSQLTAFGLNGKLVATGKSFPGNITDDMGNFAISGESVGPYLELRAEGFYFNELSGELSGPLYLEALLEPSATKANINILTTIIRQRIKELILSGDKYDKAVDKAQQEFLTSLGISLDLSSDFDQMDITRSSDADAFLLALSCMVQVDNSPAQINALLQALADDMKDGTLEEENVALLWENGSKVSVTNVIANLTEFYQSKNIADATIPEFWKYLVREVYAEVLSVKLLKGYDSGNSIMIDPALEDWQIQDLNGRGYPFQFSNKPIKNPIEIYGDYTLEITVFKMENTMLTVSAPWIKVGEPEPADDHKYVYKVNVSTHEIDGMEEGTITIGGLSYEICARYDKVGWTRLEWPNDMLAIDISPLVDYVTDEDTTMPLAVLVNGTRYPVSGNRDEFDHRCWIFIPRSDTIESWPEPVKYEVMCTGTQKTIIGETEEIYDRRGRAVYIQNARDYPYLYLYLKCPFKLTFSPQPTLASLWTYITIDGEEYKPAFVDMRDALYLVEEHKLRDTNREVLVSNMLYGSVKGYIENRPGLSVSEKFVFEYSVRFNQDNVIRNDALTVIRVDLPTGVVWREMDCCYFEWNGVRYDIGINYYDYDRLLTNPLAFFRTAIPAEVRGIYYHSSDHGLIKGTVTLEDQENIPTVVWDTV